MRPNGPVGYIRATSRSHNNTTSRIPCPHAYGSYANAPWGMSCTGRTCPAHAEASSAKPFERPPTLQTNYMFDTRQLGKHHCMEFHDGSRTSEALEIRRHTCRHNFSEHTTAPGGAPPAGRSPGQHTDKLSETLSRICCSAYSCLDASGSLDIWCQALAGVALLRPATKTCDTYTTHSHTQRGVPTMSARHNFMVTFPPPTMAFPGGFGTGPAPARPKNAQTH